MRVLLVESNVQLATKADADLTAEMFGVDVAGRGDDALYLMRDFAFDLVLVNQALVDMDGASFIRQIRMAKHNTPIIAISSIPQARLKALNSGADDVVERDIDQTELAARIRAIVRRCRGFARSQLQIGGLTLDVDSHDVVANGVRVHFTIKEFAILELLVLRRNMVLTKEVIHSQIYGGKDAPEIKIIDVFMWKIRSKLNKAGLPNFVITVWGRGYKLKHTGYEASEAIPVQSQPAQIQPALA